MAVPIPQIWGRHPSVNIDGVFIGEKLVTALSDVPEGWDERLKALGFKKTVSGWARLGSMAQAEYQYLSPEIELVGFRPEFAIDLEVEAANAPLVPYEVQDSILELWRRRRQAVDAAITLEHGQRLSTGRLWTVIEEALAGVDSPLTATLYGLAVASLQHQGGVTSEVQRFADRLKTLEQGEEAPALQAPQGKILLSQGAMVDWADRDGVVQSSRLARPVRTDDTGFWIYPGAQRWVAGYPVVAPVRVPRAALVFRGNGDAPDWGAEAAPEVVRQEAVSREGLLDPNEITVSKEIPNLLLSALARKGMDGPEWEGVFRDTLAVYSSGEGMPPEEIESAVEWVRRIKAQLAAESAITYGREPIRFELVQGQRRFGTYSGVAVAPCVVINGQIARQGRASANLALAGSINIRETCAEAERARKQREDWLRSSSELLGEIAGTAGPALSVDHVWSTEANLASIGSHYGGALTADAFYKLASIQVHKTGALEQITHRSHGGGLNHTFHQGHNALVSVGVAKISTEVVAVADVVAAVGSNTELPSKWLDGRTRSLERHAVQVSITDSEWQQIDLQGVLLYKIDWGQIRYKADAYHATLEGALGKYIETLDELRPRLPEEHHREIGELVQMAERYPLYLRLQEVPAKLRAMDDEQLQGLILSDLMRGGKGRVSGWSEGSLSNVVSRIMEVARTDGNSGVMVTFSPRYTYFNRVATTTKSALESREGAIGKAVADQKNGKRIAIVGLDSVAWADPELVALLNGASAPGLLKEPEKVGNPGADDRYEDTGVVAGFAMKDIRGFSKEQLVSCADSMSDSQKTKYLTKDNLWSRKSFQEMLEAGVDVKVAYVRDLVWKTMPGKPKSVSRDHVQAFIDLLSAFKETDARLGGDLKGYEEAIKQAVKQVFNNRDVSRYAPGTYNRRDLKMKGTGYINLKFNETVDFTSDWTLAVALNDIGWNDLIKEKVAKKTAGATGSRVQRDALVRTGPDYRNGVSVTGEDFIKTFGFSGVEYGNWTNQKEREKHLNFAYDSMMDFVRVMGWEPLTLSLGGKLGLCIGSRGRGGANAANAHFEPVNMAINLTRMRGDGALAHEFFHAVANHFGRLYRGAPIDLADAIAYPLTKRNPVLVAPEVSGGIRQQVASTFYNLMTSIIRAPAEGGDWKDLASYTGKSAMFVAAAVKDKGKREYWAQPAEMFARAMEIWVKDRLGDNNERNDYLVRAGKGDDSSLYPDAEHLERINHFVADWLEAVDTEMKAVEHPFLGAIEMPVLYSQHKSRQPLAPNDLLMLADQELQRLFGLHAPGVMVGQLPAHAAGLYDLSRDIIALDQRHADQGTFYHEVWHAAHAKLLTQQEQRNMERIFTPGGPLANHVAKLMEQQGMGMAIPGMREDAREVQAYAFQLWTQGVLNFSAYLEEACFERTRDFADGVIEAADSFGVETVEALFRQLDSGALARRKGHQLDTLCHQSVDLDGAEWDDDNLYWNPPAEPLVEQAERNAMRMR